MPGCSGRFYGRCRIAHNVHYVNYGVRGGSCASLVRRPEPKPGELDYTQPLHLSCERETHGQASEPIDKLDHVEIGANGVRPVNFCVGVMQKSVAHPESSVERSTDTDSQRKLEMAAVVLPRKGMPA